MSLNSRAKGARAELEMVHLLRTAGWPRAERTSDGRHQGQRGDIAHGPTGWHLECKHVENLNIWKALDQARRDAKLDHTPIVAFRRNRSTWYAALEIYDLLDLVR